MTVSSSPHNPSNSVIVRLRLFNEVGVLNRVTQKISDLGGNIGAIDIVRPEPDALIRDITIFTHNPEHGEKLVEGLREIEDVEFINFSDRTFLAHLQGKIEINNRLPLSTRDDLSIAYTPGVARVCTEIHKNPENAYKLTIKGNTVAVVTDGTAVLGLGDIGPKAAMPVMEGKAMLFKQFADIDAWPICLDPQTPKKSFPSSKPWLQALEESIWRTFPHHVVSKSRNGSATNSTSLFFMMISMARQ